MRKAIIDQIMLWIVIFVSFATTLFIVIDYYVVLKVKDRSDALANYGVRMKALGKEHDEIITGLNNIKSNYFDDLTENDLSCEELDTNRYQVIFTTNISIGTNMFLSDNEKIYALATAFNEYNSTDQNCTLDLSTP